MGSDKYFAYLKLYLSVRDKIRDLACKELLDILDGKMNRTGYKPSFAYVDLRKLRISNHANMIGWASRD